MNVVPSRFGYNFCHQMVFITFVYLEVIRNIIYNSRVVHKSTFYHKNVQQKVLTLIAKELIKSKN